MILAPGIVLFMAVGFWGVGDTSDAYLSVLVTQSASQLAELQKLLKTADLTVRQLDQAVDLAEKVQSGIDKALKPIEKSKQFQKALMRLRESSSLKDLRYGAEDVRDYLETYKAYFPEKSKKEEERRKEYEAFEKEMSKSNRADLEEIEKIEAEITKDSATGQFSPGRAQQISAQIQLKQWEGQVLQREQMQRLMDENNTLREEIARERRKNEIQQKQDESLVKSKWEKGWKSGL